MWAGGRGWRGRRTRRGRLQSHTLVLALALAPIRSLSFGLMPLLPPIPPLPAPPSPSGACIPPFSPLSTSPRSLPVCHSHSPYVPFSTYHGSSQMDSTAGRAHTRGEMEESGRESVGRTTRDRSLLAPNKSPIVVPQSTIPATCFLSRSRFRSTPYTLNLVLLACPPPALPSLSAFLPLSTLPALSSRHPYVKHARVFHRLTLMLGSTMLLRSHARQCNVMHPSSYRPSTAHGAGPSTSSLLVILVSLPLHPYSYTVIFSCFPFLPSRATSLIASRDLLPLVHNLPSHLLTSPERHHMRRPGPVALDPNHFP